jgi:hypothetical protein
MRKDGFVSLEFAGQLSCTMTGPKGEGKTARFYTWKASIPSSPRPSNGSSPCSKRRSLAAAAIAGSEAGVVNAIHLCTSGAGRAGVLLKAYAQGLFDDGLRTAVSVTLENGVVAKRGIREKISVERFDPSAT